MVEPKLSDPVGRDVANITFSAELSAMRIVLAVAAGAIDGQWIGQLANMATIAGERIVSRRQGESGLSRMIEFRRLPARDIVATVALNAESPLVNIVARMTRIAGAAAQSRMVGLLMTVGAGKSAMTIDKAESCPRKVVEIDGSPCRIVMAVATLRSIAAGVDVIIPVTVDAEAARTGEILRRMTGIAGR